MRSSRNARPPLRGTVPAGSAALSLLPLLPASQIRAEVAVCRGPNELAAAARSVPVGESWGGGDAGGSMGRPASRCMAASSMGMLHAEGRSAGTLGDSVGTWAVAAVAGARDVGVELAKEVASWLKHWANCRSVASGCC